MRAWPLVAGMLAMVGWAGCGRLPRRAAADPTVLLRAWASAVARDQPSEAWRLLSPELRARIPETDFRLAWRSALPDLAAQEAAIRQHVHVRQADAELPDGRALVLAHENGLWRVAAARPVAAGGETPEDTVRRLLAAIDAHDFDALLGLLAEPLRTTIEEALNERAERLRAALRRGPLDSSGTPARIRYDARYHLDLVQENGRWRIADFN
jgi:hypothetical protein